MSGLVTSIGVNNGALRTTNDGKIYVVDPSKWIYTQSRGHKVGDVLDLNLLETNKKVTIGKNGRAEDDDNLNYFKSEKYLKDTQHLAGQGIGYSPEYWSNFMKNIAYKTDPTEYTGSSSSFVDNPDPVPVINTAGDVTSQSLDGITNAKQSTLLEGEILNRKKVTNK